jgi:hypothetical protein
MLFRFKRENRQLCLWGAMVYFLLASFSGKTKAFNLAIGMFAANPVFQSDNSLLQKQFLRF